MRKILVLIVLVFSTSVQLKKKSMAVNTTKPKPNVLLILTDDLGWQDVKCYDIDNPSPYETPNIDALASNGIKFWQAYSPAPTCAPSRAAIMSGNHPARAQKTHVVGGSPPTVYLDNRNRMIDPWYSGRMPENEMTLARVLQQNGYKTGHVGKWHLAINHNAYPKPEDQGFDYTKSNRGATLRQKPNRLTNFATTKKNDAYRLDKDGFPKHQNNLDALDFLNKSKSEPFFLFYATWLVHTPIHTRSKALLEKYCKKLGLPYPTNPDVWNVKGQNNPYYAAMIEMLDYYIGQTINYLKTTDDPRWPGHKLIENTYIIFTSDNGGMEHHGPKEVITDNYPLDKGKINAKEGGVRVPLIITGPGIKKGITSDVMINGLDFYPTILSLTNIKKPIDKHLDGTDLSDLLLKDPTNPKLIKTKNGKVRTKMMWHFPHSSYQSTLRDGNYKLIRNYDYKNNPKTPEFELYKLYTTVNGKQVRNDIEEAKNIASDFPSIVQDLNDKLTESLTEMKASYPYYNPNHRGNLENKENVPTVINSEKDGSNIKITFKENGAKVTSVDLIYTLNGGEKHEEWFKKTITIDRNIASGILPKNTTHYVINLIDENNYLVSYPEIPAFLSLKKNKEQYSKFALENR